MLCSQEDIWRAPSANFLLFLSQADDDDAAAAVDEAYTIFGASGGDCLEPAAAAVDLRFKETDETQREGREKGERERERERGEGERERERREREQQ